MLTHISQIIPDVLRSLLQVTQEPADCFLDDFGGPEAALNDEDAKTVGVLANESAAQLHRLAHVGVRTRPKSPEVEVGFRLVGHAVSFESECRTTYTKPLLKVAQVESDRALIEEFLRAIQGVPSSVEGLRAAGIYPTPSHTTVEKWRNGEVPASLRKKIRTAIEEYLGTSAQAAGSFEDGVAYATAQMEKALDELRRLANPPASASERTVSTRKKVVRRSRKDGGSKKTGS